MNKCFLLGRLCADPEVRYSKGADESAVARFRLAVRRDADNTDFFGCVAFGKTADIAEKYLCKGKMIAVEAEVRNDNYTDKDGNAHYGFTFVVNRFDFCGGDEKKDSGDWENIPNKVEEKPARKNNYRR